MAYLIKNLGRIDKGVEIEISWDVKEYHLELIKKNDDIFFSYNTSKNSFLTLKITDFKTIIKIPENGFWQLLIRKESTSKVTSKLCCKFLVISSLVK